MEDETILRNRDLIARLASQVEDDGFDLQTGSTKRTAVKPPLKTIPKGPNGRRLCRWCNTEVPKGRVAYCSDTCQIEVNIRCNPSSFRFHVHQRDKGICAKCGFDTDKLERILHYANRSLHGIWIESINRYTTNYPYPYDWRRRILRAVGLDSRGALWNADHIIEVADGGGETGLENAQTLCQICHKAKTAENRRKRAAEKRTSVQPELDLCLNPD